MKRMVMVAGLIVGCTSVKMVEREGCWLKQTSRTLGGTREEMGFCTRTPSDPAQDRLARLVQECMAQADYRWENRAIASWSRGEPIPPAENDTELTKACMGQATQSLGLEAENAELKARLAELTQDREQLRSTVGKENDFLHQTSEKMVTALGEAAKRPGPTATATATSTTKSDTPATQSPPVTVMAAAPTAPGFTVIGPPPAAAPVQVARKRASQPAKPAPDCEVNKKEPPL
jgi:hypothetical protein